MIRTLVFFALLVAPTLANSADTSPSSAEILQTLSQRSGLPESDLTSLLSDCQATQQSIYFCAYRDTVAAELTLSREINAAKFRLPRCKQQIDGWVPEWKIRRDRQCKKQAAREYGEGTLAPTAALLCMTAETEAMSRRIRTADTCSKLPH